MSTGFSTRKMRREVHHQRYLKLPPRDQLQGVHNRRYLGPPPERQFSQPSNSDFEVAACPPMWYSYGNEHPVHLLHPRDGTSRNTNQRLPHHRQIILTTTHHPLQSCPKCQHLPADRVNSPSLDRYTKIQAHFHLNNRLVCPKSDLSNPFENRTCPGIQMIIVVASGHTEPLVTLQK